MVECRYRYYVDKQGRLGGDVPKCKLGIGGLRCHEKGEDSCDEAKISIDKKVPVPSIAQAVGLQPRENSSSEKTVVIYDSFKR